MCLQKYIEECIVPRYKNFDRAHGVDHVRAVINRSLFYAGRYGADARMAYVIAAYHDVGLCEDRERHHIVSGIMLAGDISLKRWFDESQIEIMRQAVEDHRASAGHEPRTLYGKIVAEADRLIDPSTVLRRAVQYGLQHYPQYGREEQFLRFKYHLIQKYGAQGYLRLWLPDTENEKNLLLLRRLLDDEKTLRTYFDDLYEDELDR